MERALETMTQRGRAILAGCCVLALGVSVALGQRGPSARSIRFGDIVLSGFETAELEIGKRAQASGPNTVVDVVDPDQTTTAQLRAMKVTAYLTKDAKARGAEGSVGRVERITADGKVQFRAVRRLPDGKSNQTVNASGTRADYDRVKKYLTLTGPVTFTAEQPSQGRAGTDTVVGKAASGAYDEGKRILFLFGDVEATVTTPDTPPEGSTITGDEVKIEMAVDPYRVTIANPSLKGAVNIRVKVPEKPDQPDSSRR